MLAVAFYSVIDPKKRNMLERDMLELTHEFCGLTPPATRFKYSDVAERDNTEALACDATVPFATAGLRLGIKDSRGAVTFHCLDYMSKGHTNSGNVNGMARLAHSHEHSTDRGVLACGLCNMRCT